MLTRHHLHLYARPLVGLFRQLHDDGPWAGRHLDAESKRVRPASRNPNGETRDGAWQLKGFLCMG